MKRLLAFEAVVLAALATLALDLYAHHRVEMLGGVNVRGYRGPVAHAKAPREIRVAIVGGTRAFAWGQGGQALTAEVRRRMLLVLDRPGQPVRPVTVVNLARLGALPAEYPAVIERYASLRIDDICVYDDLSVPGADATRSAIFDATGYAPALPLVLREKGLRWEFGDVARGYGDRSRTNGEPRVSTRMAGRLLSGVGAAMQRADDRRLDRPALSAAEYSTTLMRALDAAHAQARGVVLALSPAETPVQREARAALLAALGARAGSIGWLRVVDFDGDTRLVDPASRVDGWNYGGAAITIVAERLAAALLSLPA
jgi:hypothetical protein